MRTLVLFVLLFFVAACTMFVAGNIDERRKRVYERNNSQEYCEQNPEMCVNGVSKF